MKQIALTRVVVTGPVVDRNEAIVAGLRVLGLEHVVSHPVSDGETVTIAHRPVLLVVDSPLGSVPPLPIDTDAQRRGVIAMLLVPSPGHILIRQATVAGYSAILPSDVPARTLYRRIGALMQRHRRAPRVSIVSAVETPASQAFNPRVDGL